MEAAATIPVAIITTVGLILVALINNRHGRSIKAVREQVQNSHETNLRDDIDSVLDHLKTIQTTQKEHGEDLRQVRVDLAQERRERLAVSDRLDELAERLIA